MCYGCQQVLADLQETDGLHTAADHQRRHQVMQTAAVGPQKIYRGISVNPWSGGETSDALRELLAPGSWGQPDIDPAKLAHPDLGPALLNHVAHGNWSEWGNFRGKRPQLGRHWTTDKRIAQGFGGSGGITTVLEADHPGDVGLDPKNTGVRGRGDRSNYGHEQEVTLKPGTPLNITHVHVRHPTGWYTHDMGVSKMARAASYEVPEPWQRYYDHMSAQPDTSGNAHLMMPTDLVHHYREYDRDPADPNYQVLKKVIQEHGNQIRQPLVINADDTHGVLTEGNHRAAIARELGITHLPVRVQYGPKARANEGTPVPHHPAFKQWLDANIGGLQRQAGANGDGVDPEMTSLVHFTRPEIRDKIIQEQRFRQHPQGAHNEYSFFTTYDNRHDPDFRGKWGYGNVGVVVDVPSHAVKPDGDQNHPKSFMVHRDDLEGLPIRKLDRHARTAGTYFYAAFDPHSETIPGDPDYLYHATHDYNAQDIKDYGHLDVHDPWHGTDQDSWPDGSVDPRSYWTHDPQVARSFYPEGGSPTLLRTKRTNAPFQRERGTGDFYSPAPVSADHLEVYHGGGKWGPLHEW
ncbi:hypothetical protein SEA_JPICKLES_81 [Mycobacterium phage JPickles]|uniref:Uncharacterized protein n=3 Tax=Bixzunavirus TaxID=680114 RepID=R4TK23_9CAUD|nr:ParB-like domain protein [Mycobacterium phage Astraea]AEJ94788.1 hypothetical protein GHOST_82 [Mycobacterium phage Ghost]AKG94649.1 hypothetical protein SEA_MOMO_82 [Mycobacterium phage Momo]ATN87307.1 hypothetical protein SEA_AUDRICK_85 [Mycobacterium phage Audrick]AXY85599.1 hypothetical protein SEA_INIGOMONTOYA_84 [Mycobacterium phage InigoMontoya]AXY85834.1 hypothetical protein SEA_PHLEGM_85 [Mycobacterium phage Phlegm]QAX93608.1 hypothetical protein SEA_MELPOMINI_77 [Mycobacterium ph